MKILFPIIVLLVLLNSCSNGVAPAENRTFPVHNGKVNLANELPGDWDRICVITPYSTNRHAHEVTGLKIDIVERSNIYRSDSISLLVTIKNNEVFKLYEVPRNNINFSALGANCYSRNDSMFSIPKSGYPHVKHF